MPTHVIFDPDQLHLMQMYQMGHGIGNAFVGVPYHQRGAGLGSFFRNLFRFILPVAKPLAKSAAKAIGHEALRTGTDIASDIMSGENVKQTLKTHSKHAGKRLLKRAAKKLAGQEGSGLGKRKKAAVKMVPIKHRVARRSVRKRKKSKKRTKVTDIMGSYML